MIVQDTIQLSIAEQKSHDDLEAKQNKEKVKEHLIAEEIENMVEGTENVENNEVVNSVLNNQNDPGTMLDPGSYKKSPEVEKITATLEDKGCLRSVLQAIDPDPSNPNAPTFPSNPWTLIFDVTSTNERLLGSPAWISGVLEGVRDMVF
ncbi:hypothetical protein Tco_1105389 [Tanacetum coccineum]